MPNKEYALINSSQKSVQVERCRTEKSRFVRKMTCRSGCAFALFVTLTFFAVSIVPSFSQNAASSTSAGEQRKAEQGLKDNRYFIYYINATVTNFGTLDDERDFREIIQRDLISQFFYLRFMFSDSFRQIRKAQQMMIVLFRRLIEAQQAQMLDFLNGISPSVLHGNDHKARHYLQLAYRLTGHARIEYTMADHYRENLYSMRLYKYVRALKNIKEAGRYGVLALIQPVSGAEEKLQEIVLNYDQIRKKISLLKRDDQEKLYMMHADAYYKVLDDKSCYDTVWENPQLETFEDFKKYLAESD